MCALSSVISYEFTGIIGVVNSRQDRNCSCVNRRKVGLNLSETRRGCCSVDVYDLYNQNIWVRRYVNPQRHRPLHIKQLTLGVERKKNVAVFVSMQLCVVKRVVKTASFE